MNIQDILLELGRQIGLSPLTLSPEGVLDLNFDGKFTVNIECIADENIVRIHSVLGLMHKIVSAEKKAAFIETLLTANLFGQKTGGASFGYDSNTDEIFLFRSFPADDIHYEHFRDALEHLLNALEGWTNHIEQGDHLMDLGSHSHEDDDEASRHPFSSVSIRP